MLVDGKTLESSSPENLHRLSVLRDLYEGLLPPRQREVIAMKLDEDLSLSEMAERLGVSRQACEDALKRGERALVGAETKLHLGERLAHEEKCMGEVESALERMTGDDWPQYREFALRWIKAMREGGVTDNGI